MTSRGRAALRLGRLTPGLRFIDRGTGDIGIIEKIGGRVPPRLVCITWVPLPGNPEQGPLLTETTVLDNLGTGLWSLLD